MGFHLKFLDLFIPKWFKYNILWESVLKRYKEKINDYINKDYFKNF